MAENFQQEADGGWIADFLVIRNAWKYGDESGVFTYRVMTLPRSSALMFCPWL